MKRLSFTAAIALSFIYAVALASCGSGADIVTSPADAGAIHDAGTRDAGADAGAHNDAGAPVDAGAAVDAGSHDAGTESEDAGSLDAGELDAGDFDAGAFDAGELDAGPIAAIDAGSFDAGEPDAGDLDAGPIGTIDAGSMDAGPVGTTDAGSMDAGSFDAGSFDAGSMDAGAFDAGPIGSVDAGAWDGGVISLRIMTGNLTSGNDQSYEQPGIDIFAGLHPDVALVQEFNVGGNTQAEIDAFVVAAFGSDVNYFRESGSAIQIPNGIVSRFPIVDSGVFVDPSVANRSFAWAKIELPNGAFLWAYSLHLLTTSATNRNNEAVALVADIKAQVPAGDYLTIGGDFNTDSRTEACVTTLSGVTVTTGPYPVDNKGNADTSTNRNDPHDWVLASSNLNKLETAAVVGTSTFANGLVVDTRVYTPLSDIAPAVEGDSGASGMQHMAVVRDFAIP